METQHVDRTQVSPVYASIAFNQSGVTRGEWSVPYSTPSELPCVVKMDGILKNHHACYNSIDDGCVGNGLATSCFSPLPTANHDVLSF